MKGPEGNTIFLNEPISWSCLLIFGLLYDNGHFFVMEGYKNPVVRFN